MGGSVMAVDAWGNAVPSFQALKRRAEAANDGWAAPAQPLKRASDGWGLAHAPGVKRGAEFEHQVHAQPFKRLADRGWGFEQVPSGKRGADAVAGDDNDMDLSAGEHGGDAVFEEAAKRQCDPYRHDRKWRGSDAAFLSQTSSRRMAPLATSEPELLKYM